MALASPPNTSLASPSASTAWMQDARVPAAAQAWAWRLPNMLWPNMAAAWKYNPPWAMAVSLPPSLPWSANHKPCLCQAIPQPNSPPYKAITHNKAACKSTYRPLYSFKCLFQQTGKTLIWRGWGFKFTQYHQIMLYRQTRGDDGRRACYHGFAFLIGDHTV